MEYKVAIDEDFIRNAVNIYIGLENGPTFFLTYANGYVTANALDPGAPSEAFLKLPAPVYKAIEKQIIENLEYRGGAPSQQYLRGKVEQLEKQVQWLQSQVELIPHIFKH